MANSSAKACYSASLGMSHCSAMRTAIVQRLVTRGIEETAVFLLTAKVGVPTLRDPLAEVSQSDEDDAHQHDRVGLGNGSANRVLHANRYV